MALTGTSIFPQGREINVNFDWVDTATATGYLVYDGWASVISGGTTHHITPSSDMKNHLVSSKVDVTGVKQKDSGATLDIDFDATEFQLPRTIEGQAIVRIGGYFDESGVGAGHTFAFTAIIRKWDGATETTIATGTQATVTIDDDGPIGANLIIDVPRTHFKKGEQLRLTITATSSSGGGGAVTVFLGFNPSDAQTGVIDAGNSRLVLAVPFKLDYL